MCKVCGPLVGWRSIYSSNPRLFPDWQDPRAKEAILYRFELYKNSYLGKEEQQTREMISLTFIITNI